VFGQNIAFSGEVNQFSLPQNLKKYEIWGLQFGETFDSNLLGYNAVYFGRYMRIIRGSYFVGLQLTYPKHGDGLFIRKVVNVIQGIPLAGQHNVGSTGPVSNSRHTHLPVNNSTTHPKLIHRFTWSSEPRATTHRDSTTTVTPCLEYSRLKREPHTYTPYGCTYSSELLMLGNDGSKHVELF
jgi:hypothetical protein